MPGGYAEHQHGHVPEDQTVFWKSAHRFHNPSVFCSMQLFKATKFTSETLYSSCCLCWYFWWGSILSIFYYISTLPLIASFHQIYILSLLAVHTQTFLHLAIFQLLHITDRGTKTAEQLTRVKIKLHYVILHGLQMTEQLNNRASGAVTRSSLPSLKTVHFKNFLGRYVTRL